MQFGSKVLKFFGESFTKIRDNLKTQKIYDILTMQNIYYASSAVALLLFCVFSSISFSSNAEFWLMNGDFQNYNPWRRLLDGQIPYKDFSVYLGSGHLFLGSILTGIFGGSFVDSKFAAMFLNCIITIFAVMVVAFLAIKNKAAAVFVAVFCVFAVQFANAWLDILFLDGLLSNEMINLVNVGISGHMIRTGIIVILPVLIILCLKLIKKYIKDESRARLVCFISVAALCGMSIMYSNDSGVASYICASFCAFMYMLKQYKKDIKRIALNVLLWIGCSMAAYGVFAFIISGGRIMSYIDKTFGVAGYQFWYYELGPHRGPYFVSDIFNNLETMHYFALVFAAYQIVRYFRENEFNSLLLAFISLSSFTTSKLYYIFSGHPNNVHLNYMLNIFVIAYIFKYIIIAIKAANFKLSFAGAILPAVFILAYIPAMSAILDGHDRGRDVDDYYYVSELGGVTHKRDGLYKLSERIGDETLFSTYATGLEAIKGKFQPTGYDYIIHVMGDKAREEYVAKFLEGEYQHVTNPVLSTNPYAGWIRQANWFFFRELYPRYDLTGEFNYIGHWQRSETDNYLDVNVDVEILEIENGGYRIICKADKPVNAVADVLVTYTIVSNKKRGGMFRTLCSVSDPTFSQSVGGLHSGYNLPGIAKDLPIPITLVNGTGEVYLTPYPLNYTQMIDIKATVNRVMKNPYVPDSPIAAEDFTGSAVLLSSLTDDNWTNGVLNAGNVLLFENSERNNILLIQNESTTISVDGYSAEIISRADLGAFIHVRIEETADKTRFAYPAELTVS